MTPYERRAGGSRLLAVTIAIATAGTACQRASPAPTSVPDLNGTWGHATVLGLEFVKPEKLPDGSVCMFGCTPQADGGGGGAGGQEPPPPDFPRYKPELLAKVADLSARQVDTDTVLRCYPPGVPRIGPPSKIVQTAGEVVFLYDDYNGSFFRVIRLLQEGAPAAAPPDVPRSYLGRATGRFEGNELIVESDNFTDETWLTDNGAFHTAALRVVERLRRDGDDLHYQATAHDPEILAEPWVMRPRTLKRSTRDLEEPPRCDERDLDQIIDRSYYHDNPR